MVSWSWEDEGGQYAGETPLAPLLMRRGKRFSDEDLRNEA